jgi:hypothetical protein
VTAHTVLCQAIGSRTLLTFDYNGKPRIVAPYCYGVTAKNVEVLRAIQVGGRILTTTRTITSWRGSTAASSDSHRRPMP